MLKQSFAVCFSIALTAVLFTVGCSAQPMADADALRELRELTKGGKMPAESVVEGIEQRFRGTRTGALATLLRARVRFENKDFRGAAALLNNGDLKKLTDVADHGLWLRGLASQNAGDHAGALAAFEQLWKEFPASLRADDARLRWAESAIASGRAAEVSPTLTELVKKHNAEALLLTAKAFDAAGNSAAATANYRKAFLYGAGNDIGKDAEAKLISLGQSTAPADAEEATVRTERLLQAGSAAMAFDAFTQLIATYPAAVTPEVHLNRLKAAANAKDPIKAQAAFDAMPATMDGRDQAYRELINTYAKAKQWPRARAIADEMRTKFPQSPLTVKAWVEAGYAARDAKVRAEETHFLRSALVNYPNAVEVAGAQFELAWLEHEAGNYARAADLLVEHLARYAAKDTTNRGRAGYWAARNSERAGRIPDACALYEAVVYRYNANWYGYIGDERLRSLRERGQCKAGPQFASGSLVPQAAANLKTVTVAPERAGQAELARTEKGDQLSSIGLFDWAIDELKEAQKTAQNSPSVNMALARHYRMRSDNVNALLALAKSYPDYAQMFPEEMGREEWEIFYPHMAWEQIAKWSRARNLDIYKVAGLIRQESVFNVSAKSSANAYGLMQLLLPTAQMMARKYGAAAPVSSASSLYDPALNIELGTAYMREQLEKYGRIEYMAVAYNAGPGRVVQWRKTLPMEMDEFVEAIPFRETKGYVQGVIRNMAQYRRLYDENGNFRPNVGTKPIRAAIDTKPAEQFAAEFPEVRIGDDLSAE